LIEENKANVLLTGATGFVGGGLAELLEKSPHIDLKCAVRREGTATFGRETVISELDSQADWSDALAGRSVVIHAAARAHIMKDEVSDPLSEYRKVNVDGTLNLARQAAEAGVRRFVFISSIKVNGEQTPLNKPFTPDDAPAPEDAYGISKK
jgi:nucleoside-diphosphate-sugar epimerase